MGCDLFYRARLLILASALALGGAMGNAGRAALSWMLTAGTAVMVLAALARMDRRTLAWFFLALLFLYVGFFAGWHSSRAWRAGEAGRAG